MSSASRALAASPLTACRFVMHALALGAGNGEVLEAEQVAAFLGERYLVTVHRKPVKQLETVWRRAIADGNSGAESVDFLLYLIVDAITPSQSSMRYRIDWKKSRLRYSVGWSSHNSCGCSTCAGS